MVLGSASEISQSTPKGKGGDDPPFFFVVSLNELADGAFAGQAHMDETITALRNLCRN
jgi:hypothetical protein